MENILEKIMERLSKYDFLNNVIPGTIYVVFLESVSQYEILSGQVFIDLIIFYFVGTVINRFGSLLIEPSLKKLKLIKYVSHEDYIYAEKSDVKVFDLLTINNMFRTYTALACCILFTVIISNCELKFDSIIICGSIALVFLFGASYIKQTKYIVTRCTCLKNKNSSSIDSTVKSTS